MPVMSLNAISLKDYGGMFLMRACKQKIFDCTDTGLAVRALMGVMNWTLTWYRPEGNKTIEQIADEYSDLLFHGLLK